MVQGLSPWTSCAFLSPVSCGISDASTFVVVERVGVRAVAVEHLLLGLDVVPPHLKSQASAYWWRTASVLASQFGFFFELQLGARR